MRNLTLNLLVVALLLFGATSASAFAVNMTARGAGVAGISSLATSDTVTVDVFLDATGGITIFSVAVINDTPAALLYDGPASSALPPSPDCLYPLCGNTFGSNNGAQPSYVLYGMVGKSTSYLVPLQTPHFLNFPPEFSGTEQVNVNYTDFALGTTITTGQVYVATLVFHVVAGFDVATLSLAFTSSNLIQTGTVVTDPATIGLSAPISLTGHVPEPTTAMLIGLGILGLGLAGRR